MSIAEPTDANAKTLRGCAIAALVVALVGSVGSLYLSLGMGLKACPLCFYQRSFVMAVAAVLLVGWLSGRAASDVLCLVCLPLAVAGLGVAAFHEYLVLAGKLECPLAILGLGTAPAQSLAVFIALTVAVGIGALGIGAIRSLGPAAAAVGLGLAMAWGSIASAPPMPPAPTKPYDQPLEMCRPPFVDAEN